MTPEEATIRAAELALYQDLVKIGLPAAITAFTAILGAISAYWITGIKYKQDKETEIRKEKIYAYKEIVNKVTVFSSSLVKYCTLLKSKNSESNFSYQEALEDAEITFINSQGDLGFSLALLGMYGEQLPLEKLRTYEDLSIDLLHNIHNLSDEEYHIKTAQLAETKLDFMKSLGNSYKSVEK